jgi:hypothetical protein
LRKHRDLRHDQPIFTAEPGTRLEFWFGTWIRKPKSGEPMGDAGIFKTGQHVWQRANIMAAANYLRDQITRTPDDARLKSLYEGLLEVLDPSRRAVRVQRELAALTVATTPVKTERRRRDRRDAQRRIANLGPPPGMAERRSGIERRAGKDRRHR